MNLKYNSKLDIAVGRSREETRWQNKEMTWQELLKRLQNTQRTHETYAEYLKLKPGRQDAIKDVGGFVGGLISGGRRGNKSIIHRQIVTLDIDATKMTADEFWDLIETSGFAVAMYTTHKHCPDKARLRFLIPLDRPATPDEYEAIARKIASWFNIDEFDDTTFQPARLMYWPSTSKDGEYIFKYQDAPWLKADEILLQYKDWQDSSQWPVSCRVDDIAKARGVKQGDPLIKSGLIGAFCRTYTIQEAIEKFLEGIYIPSEDPDRYTYILGSVANGLVIYDDKYAYSHHSTDPVSQKTCNAFDLVRLHKYRHLDENAAEDTPVVKMPSYIAMSDLVASDHAVRRTIGEEKLQEAQEAFAQQDAQKIIPGLSEEEILKLEGTWMEQMEVDKKTGNYLPTINNIILILENDPGLKGKFALNVFEHREMITADVPWRRRGRKPYINDADFAALRHYLELIYGLFNVNKVEDAMSIVMERHSFHPIADWLDTLEWDGKARAERLFIDYLGAENNSYTRTVTRKALLACVSRIYEAGCKFDEMIVLVGDQGIGKSTILKKLAYKWFSDSLTDIRGKDALEQLQGAWIIEMGELDAMKKSDISAFKHFLAKGEDRFRVAYGRRVESFPRECVFFGTINEFDFLKDTSGNRRFWPIATDIKLAYKNVFTELTISEVEQVWAEVKGWYHLGENLFLEALVKEQAKQVQEKHMVSDDRVGMIEAYLDTLLPATWADMLVTERRIWLNQEAEELVPRGITKRDIVSVAEIWCELLNGNMKDFNSYCSRELHGLMKRIPGWEYSKQQSRRAGPQYGRQTIYKRVDCS